MSIRLTTHPLTPDPGRLPHGTTPDAAIISRLTQSFEQMKLNRARLAERFYEALFKTHPNIRAMFPADMSKQQQKLVDTLEWVVANLQRPDDIRKALAELGGKHQGYGAVASHFPIVRDHLIVAMSEVAGPSWTAEIEADWRTAIDLIARQMLGAYK